MRVPVDAAMIHRSPPAGFLANESLRPDLNRALRAMLDFMPPMLAALMGWLAQELFWKR